MGSADLPALMGYFDKALLESTATNSLRLKEATDHEIARIASRSLDPPGQAQLASPVIVKRGFWQRLLDATGNPALPPGG